MKTKNWTENTNLEVVRIDPLSLCIDGISEGAAVGMVEQERDDFLLHEEKFLCERVTSVPGDDLRLVVARLWYHGVTVSVSRHTLAPAGTTLTRPGTSAAGRARPDTGGGWCNTTSSQLPPRSGNKIIRILINFIVYCSVAVFDEKRLSLLRRYQ